VAATEAASVGCADAVGVRFAVGMSAGLHARSSNTQSRVGTEALENIVEDYIRCVGLHLLLARRTRRGNCSIIFVKGRAGSIADELTLPVTLPRESIALLGAPSQASGAAREHTIEGCFRNGMRKWREYAGPLRPQASQV